MISKISWGINFLVDRDRKSLTNINKDLRLLKQSSNASLMYYFACLMYKKNAGDIFNYINRSEYLNIINIYYRGNGEHPILQNKNTFEKYLKDFNIPKPEKIGEIIKGRVFVNNKNIDKSFKDFFKEFQKNDVSLFIKQVDSEGGKGVYKLDSKTRLDTIVININSSYIIEKEIVQHTELRKINPYCLNTLRVITVNKSGEIIIPDCFFRMGTGNSFVDNGSSGGIFIHYDIYKNTMDKVAYKLPESGGTSYYKHPTTGFKFEGAGLPFSEEVIELVSKAARCFSDIELIGWDIAYTPEGPIVLEANDNPHITMMQISCKGIKSNSIYNEVFGEFISKTNS